MQKFQLKKYILTDQNGFEIGYNYNLLVKDFLIQKQYNKKELFNEIVKFGKGHFNQQKIRSIINNMEIE